MIDLCWLCETHPIESIKRPLCQGCYQACRKKKLLHIFPLINSEREIQERAIGKYGAGFLLDMEILRDGETTLEAVGKKYGISRERIRQLYPAFFNGTYSDAVEKRSDRFRTESTKKAEEFGRFENRVIRAKKNGPVYTGIIAENLFFQRCKTLGYAIEMQKGHALFDAIVNGIPVDIKSCSMARVTIPKSHRLYYSFGTTDKQREAVVYFPFYLFDEDSWYIIPSADVSGLMYYTPKYDTDYNGYHKYRDIQKYREAWDLLKPITGGAQ